MSDSLVDRKAGKKILKPGETQEIAGLKVGIFSLLSKIPNSYSPLTQELPPDKEEAEESYGQHGKSKDC
jgi:hypothetical protein